MNATSMCPPSSASSSGENTLDHPSSKSRANGPGGAESSAAHSETAAKPAADNSGISSSGGGNNTRSFRFLLTLALRKAQTAVTLDNGGHVDEAIRTYREAISMLGLVLNRTNEEDGRQRLLHFQQQQQQQSHPEASPKLKQEGLNSDYAGIYSKQDIDSLQDAAKDNSVSKETISGVVSIENTPQLTSEAEAKAINNEIVITISPSTEQSVSLNSTPVLSPVVLNKPLPPLTPADEPEISSRRNSTASATSVDSTNERNTKSTGRGNTGANADQQNDNKHKADQKASDATASTQEAAPNSGLSNSIVNVPDEAPIHKELKLKKKDRDSEKANRRQSIKNQRSLPAMFGIGAKAKNENKPMPPVPHLQTAESNTPTLGRRLLGALRSNSSTHDLPVSKIPSAPGVESSMLQGITKASSSHNEESSVGAVDTAASMPVRPENTHDATTSSTDEMVIVETQADPNREMDTADIPPPTPAKDIPSGMLLKYSTQQTLTKEQKRQSNAAHRLAGLFRRKPSIPDLPSPVPPPKTSIDTNKSNYGLMQSPSIAHMMPKDRRLSASASTPNLIEAVTAAASNDQPALAVYAATERGDIPPMPAPPALRPSLSSTIPGASYTEGRLSTEEGEYETKDADSDRAFGVLGRKVRSDSASDTSSLANASGLSRMDEHLRLKQQQQQIPRPSLRITTKSAMDVLTFVPESSLLSNVPMTAGIDGPGRSRKSSVATTGSQPAVRGGIGLLSGPASAIMSGTPMIATPPVAASQAYGRPTLLEIEEDQRVEMFEPSFGTFHPDLGPAPPKSSPLSALWFISTLHRSMVSGGAHLTPSLYVPRRLWFQSGIRIAAIETKLSVLAQLTQSFSSIGSLLILPDIDLLFSSTAPTFDARHAETVPWESEDPRSRNSHSKDELHKACVALHHWLNSLEDMLESNRRLLGRKLKFVNAAMQTTASAVEPLAPSVSVMAIPATASHENLNASILHMPSTSVAGLADSTHFANASLPSLALSNSDLGGNHGAPISPLSPPTEPGDVRFSDMRVPDTPSAMSIIGNGPPSALNMSRDVISKDQMSNSRFKGLGKFGKSVDKLYSNIQKEKLDDTSAYIAALQRMFEAVMVLEGIMHYFSRIASDSDMAGWFTEVPQSPSSSLASKRRHQHHGQGNSDASIRGPMASPSLAQATLVSEPSASSINSLSERKLSNASISVSSTATDKKNRRRSNYFGQRQSSSNNAIGAVDINDSTHGARVGAKPRGESFSAIPRIAPAIPILAGASGISAGGYTSNAGGRFVIAHSPIKNPLSYVQQGKGRAPGVIYARLVKVTEWLSQVLLAWVVRDLQVLYAKYIKRLREWVVE
ncbi:hypothetical protein EDC05_002496 [Coemansia umbellata]|uniref:MIT domain-containing protein n=1 Tax=Coemansia umbellata TaxID=1424467 RepID=A0ABQ8PNR3_9FUNG|nr:hypothetical protein EDC05_002496 [Coemansia umbellata]